MGVKNQRDADIKLLVRQDKEEDKENWLGEGKRERKKQEAGGEGDTATVVIKVLETQFTARKIFTETGYSQIKMLTNHRMPRFAHRASSHRRSIDCCPAWDQ